MHDFTFPEILSMTAVGLFLQLVLPFIHGCILKSCRSEGYKQRTSRTTVPTFSVDIESNYGNLTDESREDEDIFRSDVSFCRLGSLHAFFWIFVWITVLVFGIRRQLEYSDDIALVLLISSGIGLGFGLLWMNIESCYSWEIQYIDNLSSEDTGVSFLNELRKVKPSLQISIECYHYETRTRSRNTKNTDGFNSGTESYQVKVVDKYVTEEFKFGTWKDVSMPPEKLTLNPKKVTRVRIVKMIRFGDKATADSYKQQYNEFYDRIKRMGNWEHMNVTENDLVPGFESRIACYWEKGDKSWWMAPTCYWLFSAFCLTWIYRLVFNKATQKTSYKLIKLLYVDKNTSQNSKY